MAPMKHIRDPLTGRCQVCHTGGYHPGIVHNGIVYNQKHQPPGQPKVVHIQERQPLTAPERTDHQRARAMWPSPSMVTSPRRSMVHVADDLRTSYPRVTYPDRYVNQQYYNNGGSETSRSVNSSAGLSAVTFATQTTFVDDEHESVSQVGRSRRRSLTPPPRRRSPTPPPRHRTPTPPRKTNARTVSHWETARTKMPRVIYVDAEYDNKTTREKLDVVKENGRHYLYDRHGRRYDYDRFLKDPWYGNKPYRNDNKRIQQENEYEYVTNERNYPRKREVEKVKSKGCFS